MTTLHMGTQTWVVLNDEQAVADIIKRHNRITSQRPEMPIASDLVSCGMRTVLRRTAQWAEGRRVMHHLLNGSVLRLYGNWQEIESAQLLFAYLKRPKFWYAHHYRYSIAVLYLLVMGEKLSKTQSELDDYQRVTMEFLWGTNRSLIDFFPQVAAWIPHAIQWWRPFWSRMGAFHRRVFQDWWYPIKVAVRCGHGNPGFVRDTLLHPKTDYKGSEEEAMYLATSVIAAGSDNTRMTLNVFIMAMISYRKVFMHARSEIDRLCDLDGHLRLPNMADMDHLPYICAMIKEVLRWRPTVPMVPQHQLTENLDYRGYHFPRGLNFVINNVSLSQRFHKPDTFDPGRWLDGSEGNIVDNLWAFGGGRRICVGYRVAQQSLFAAMVRIIFCFDLVAVSEFPASPTASIASCRLITLQDGPFDNQNLNHMSLTEPFPVKITVRSPEHEQLISQEVLHTDGL